jgi:hypothetical protein
MAAKDLRYNRSEKGRARVARYEASEKAKARHARNNAKTNPRRVYAGRRMCGVADTADTAAVINAHVKERRLGFKQRQQTRAQAESL